MSGILGDELLPTAVTRSAKRLPIHSATMAVDGQERGQRDDGGERYQQGRSA